MKWIFIVMGFVMITGCDYQRRNEALDKKMNELNQREAVLSLKEQQMEIKEQQINEKEKILDSTAHVINDSLLRSHKKTEGAWRVDMICTQTNCPGSAVGDVKTERWNITVEGRNVLVNVKNNRALSKSYSGAFDGNLITLTADQDTTEVNATIEVHLQQATDKEMEGDRVVTQASGCQILYSLRLKRQ